MNARNVHVTALFLKKKHYMETKLVNIDAYLYIQNYKSQT